MFRCEDSCFRRLGSADCNSSVSFRVLLFSHGIVHDCGHRVSIEIFVELLLREDLLFGVVGFEIGS